VLSLLVRILTRAHVHADVGVAIESTIAVLIRHPRWISLAHCSTVRHTHSHTGVPLFFHTPPTHQHSNRPPLHSSLSVHIAYRCVGSVFLLACARAHHVHSVLLVSYRACSMAAHIMVGSCLVSFCGQLR